MRQETYIEIKKCYFLLFTLLILLFGCSAQKIVITNEPYIQNDTKSTVYADWKEAVANNDFLSARKFPLSVSEEKLVKGYELLLNQKVTEAEIILKDLWQTDSVYRKEALYILYEYYFHHTKWAEMMGIFPDGYKIVKDYNSFPHEKIVFPEEDIVLIPIKKFNYGNTPVVAVQINGKKHYFIVDTGFDISTVSSEVAKECGITQGSNKMGIQDANNVLKKNAATPAYIKELKISNLTVLNHPVIVSDNLQFKILGITVYKIDGVIGWNLLQKLKVQIDNQNKKILLSRSDKKNLNRGMINGIQCPFITVTTSNGSKLFLHFDTGAKGISLSNNALNRLGQKVSSEKTVRTFGLNKNRKEKEKIIDNLSFFIGNSEFNISEISVSKLEISPGNLIQLNGRIGNSPFLNGVVSFDYQNGIFEYTESE